MWFLFVVWKFINIKSQNPIWCEVSILLVFFVVVDDDVRRSFYAIAFHSFVSTFPVYPALWFLYMYMFLHFIFILYTHALMNVYASKNRSKCKNLKHTLRCSVFTQFTTLYFVSWIDKFFVVVFLENKKFRCIYFPWAHSQFKLNW